MDGQPVVPEGTKVSGRVVAARESGRLHNSGYLRLTLSSLNLSGKEMAIQTWRISIGPNPGELVGEPRAMKTRKGDLQIAHGGL